MKKSTSHNLRKKKKTAYSNYYFALALYNIYKNESKNEARLPVRDFRNSVFQKPTVTAKLKQKLVQFVLAMRKVTATNVFIRKEKPVIIGQQL